MSRLRAANPIHICRPKFARLIHHHGALMSPHASLPSLPHPLSSPPSLVSHHAPCALPPARPPSVITPHAISSGRKMEQRCPCTLPRVSVCVSASVTVVVPLSVSIYLIPSPCHSLSCSPSVPL